MSRAGIRVSFVLFCLSGTGYFGECQSSRGSIEVVVSVFSDMRDAKADKRDQTLRAATNFGLAADSRRP